MAQNQGSPIDMGWLEIYRLKVQNLASAPAAGGNLGPGSVYYDTAVGAMFWRVGSTWIDPLDRANHKSTQLANTISNFDTQVRTSKLNQMAAPDAAVAFGSQKITSLANGSAASDAAAFGQIAAAVAALRLKNIANDGDIPIAGFKITGAADPTNPQDLTTKNYVDNKVNGTDWKTNARAAATGNVALTGLQTLDGVSMAADQTALLMFQSSPAENGAWLVKSGAWVRHPEWTQGNLTSGAAVFVSEGSTKKGQYVVSTADPITVGTTPIAFVQIGAAVSYTGDGATIQVSGNAVSAIVGANGALVRGWSAVLGDGVATSFVCNHNFGTKKVMVQVFESTSGATYGADAARTDNNNVTISVANAPTAGFLTVVIQG